MWSNSQYRPYGNGYYVPSQDINHRSLRYNGNYYENQHSNYFHDGYDYSLDDVSFDYHSYKYTSRRHTTWSNVDNSRPQRTEIASYRFNYPSSSYNVVSHGTDDSKSIFAKIKSINAAYNTTKQVIEEPKTAITKGSFIQNDTYNRNKFQDTVDSDHSNTNYVLPKITNNDLNDLSKAKIVNNIDSSSRKIDSNKAPINKPNYGVSDSNLEVNSKVTVSNKNSNKQKDSSNNNNSIIDDLNQTNAENNISLADINTNKSYFVSNIVMELNSESTTTTSTANCNLNQPSEKCLDSKCKPPQRNSSNDSVTTNSPTFSKSKFDCTDNVVSTKAKTPLKKYSDTSHQTPISKSPLIDINNHSVKLNSSVNKTSNLVSATPKQSKSKLTPVSIGRSNAINNAPKLEISRENLNVLPVMKSSNTKNNCTANINQTNFNGIEINKKCDINLNATKTNKSSKIVKSVCKNENIEINKLGTDSDNKILSTSSSEKANVNINSLPKKTVLIDNEFDKFVKGNVHVEGDHYINISDFVNNEQSDSLESLESSQDYEYDLYISNCRTPMYLPSNDSVSSDKSNEIDKSILETDNISKNHVTENIVVGIEKLVNTPENFNTCDKSTYTNQTINARNVEFAKDVTKTNSKEKLDDMKIKGIIQKIGHIKKPKVMIISPKNPKHEKKTHGEFNVQKTPPVSSSELNSQKTPPIPSKYKKKFDFSSDKYHGCISKTVDDIANSGKPKSERSSMSKDLPEIISTSKSVKKQKEQIAETTKIHGHSLKIKKLLDVNIFSQRDAKVDNLDNTVLSDENTHCKINNSYGTPDNKRKRQHEKQNDNNKKRAQELTSEQHNFEELNSFHCKSSKEKIEDCSVNEICEGKRPKIDKTSKLSKSKTDDYSKTNSEKKARKTTKYQKYEKIQTLDSENTKSNNDKIVSVSNFSNETNETQNIIKSSDSILKQKCNLNDSVGCVKDIKGSNEINQYLNNSDCCQLNEKEYSTENRQNVIDSNINLTIAQDFENKDKSFNTTQILQNFEYTLECPLFLFAKNLQLFSIQDSFQLSKMFDEYKRFLNKEPLTKNVRRISNLNEVAVFIHFIIDLRNCFKDDYAYQYNVHVTKNSKDCDIEHEILLNDYKNAYRLRELRIFNSIFQIAMELNMSLEKFMNDSLFLSIVYSKVCSSWDATRQCPSEQNVKDLLNLFYTKLRSYISLWLSSSSNPNLEIPARSDSSKVNFIKTECNEIIEISDSSEDDFKSPGEVIEIDDDEMSKNCNTKGLSQLNQCNLGVVGFIAKEGRYSIDSGFSEEPQASNFNGYSILCKLCEKPALIKCALCKYTCYCSKSCQTAHWISHHRKACPGATLAIKAKD